MVKTLTVRALLRPLIPAAVAMRRYEQKFFSTTTWRNMHLGVFASFAEARDFAAGRGVRPGYAIDQELWRERHTKLAAHDYPALFWLGHAATAGCRVFDLGGSVGVTYLAFKRLLALLASVDWEVCELPDVVARGAQIAERLHERRLTFTTDMTRLAGSDILFAAGALQFIEDPLEVQLERSTSRPRHLLINRLPVVEDHPTFVTLQNTGQSIAPCRVVHGPTFIDRMSRLGYLLVDRWRCFENSLEIPFQPDLHLDWFQGFYFARDQVPS